MGNYNNMEVWQDAKNLAVRIYHLTNQRAFSKDFSLRDQIRRAAVSIPSNLAEGEESVFNKVSIKHFSIACGSLAELRTQMEIAKEIGYLDDNNYDNLAQIMIVLNKRIKKLIQFRKNKIN